MLHHLRLVKGRTKVFVPVVWNRDALQVLIEQRTASLGTQGGAKINSMPRYDTCIEECGADVEHRSLCDPPL